jgi:hypothetical protein
LKGIAGWNRHQLKVGCRGASSDRETDNHRQCTAFNGIAELKKPKLKAGLQGRSREGEETQAVHSI